MVLLATELTVSIRPSSEPTEVGGLGGVGEVLCRSATALGVVDAAELTADVIDPEIGRGR